jgi:hypothetical protein
VLDRPVLASPGPWRRGGAVDAGVLTTRLPQALSVLALRLAAVLASSRRGEERPRAARRARGRWRACTRASPRRVTTGSCRRLGGADSVSPSTSRAEEPLLAGERFEALLTELVHEVAGSAPRAAAGRSGCDRDHAERSRVRCGARRVEPVEPTDATDLARLAERVVAPLGLRPTGAPPMVDAPA